MLRPALALLLLLLASGCHPDAKPLSDEASGAAVESRAFAADGEAVAAGYRERLRMGMGSPFRLMEYALLDERLDASTRRAVAGELLGRVRDGRLYAIDPAALSPVSAAPAAAELQWGQRNLALIEETVRRAGDPRAGELTVRLGYEIAVVEKSVDAGTAAAAAQAASLIRDRELARRDAQRLVRAAAQAGVAPVDLVIAWRRERRFQVEAPALQALPPRLEVAAIEAVPFLTRALWALRLRAPLPAPGDEFPEPEGDALARLAGATDSGDPLPQASVVAAIRQTSALPGRLTETQREAWAAFSRNAVDEEGFAARYRTLVEREPELHPVLAAAALRVSVGLRAYAQERPWHPGLSTAPADLQEHYGVQVRVADDVPASWVQPTLHALDGSLAALGGVLPSLNLLGLRIEVTRKSSIDRALASHSPRGRVLEWPVTTGPGTLAHEIAHDLDWQAARRAGGGGYGYASSRAAARGRNSFAAALATLTPATAERGAASSDHATRPAEVVARNFEWFVLTQLAATGRSDGVLSSAQDDVLTGHGSLQAPAISAAYGPALLEALRPLVSIPDEGRRGFLAEYGPARWPRASLLLRSTTASLAGIGTSRAAPAAPGQRLSAARVARDQALAGLTDLLCRTPATLVDPSLAGAHRDLIRQATAARGRAAAIDFAGSLAAVPGRQWMLRTLHGPFWPDSHLDPAAEALLVDVVRQVEQLDEPSADLLPAGSILRAPRASCAADGPGEGWLGVYRR